MTLEELAHDATFAVRNTNPQYSNLVTNCIVCESLIANDDWVDAKNKYLATINELSRHAQTYRKRLKLHKQQDDLFGIGGPQMRREHEKSLNRSIESFRVAIAACTAIYSELRNQFGV